MYPRADQGFHVFYARDQLHRGGCRPDRPHWLRDLNDGSRCAIITNPEIGRHKPQKGEAAPARNRLRPDRVPGPPAHSCGTGSRSPS